MIGIVVRTSGSLRRGVNCFSIPTPNIVCLFMWKCLHRLYIFVGMNLRLCCVVFLFFQTLLKLHIFWIYLKFLEYQALRFTSDISTYTMYKMDKCDDVNLHVGSQDKYTISYVLPPYSMWKCFANKMPRDPVQSFTHVAIT